MFRESFAHKKAVEEQAGVDYLFIVGSHTHNGAIELSDVPSKENSYQKKFEAGIIEAIIQAEKRKFRPSGRSNNQRSRTVTEIVKAKSPRYR